MKQGYGLAHIIHIVTVKQLLLMLLCELTPLDFNSVIWEIKGLTWRPPKSPSSKILDFHNTTPKQLAGMQYGVSGTRGSTSNRCFIYLQSRASQMWLHKNQTYTFGHYLKQSEHTSSILVLFFSPFRILTLLKNLQLTKFPILVNSTNY